jgi:DNA-directed RNA polymerase alpha subunit
MKIIKIFLVNNANNRFLLVKEPKINDRILEVLELEVPDETINLNIVNSISKIFNTLIRSNVDTLYVRSDTNLDPQVEENLSKLVVDTNLSNRVLNVLKEAGIYDLKGIILMGKKKLRMHRNMGDKCLLEVEAILILNELDWET